MKPIELTTYDGCRAWASTTWGDEPPGWGTAVIADEDLPVEVVAPTPTESIEVRCYLHEDGVVMIPQDCQSDPHGLEGRWVEACSGTSGVMLPDGVPRLAS